MTQPLWKSVWGFLEKNKNRITIGPSTSILGTYPKEDICTPTFIAALLMIVRRRKQSKCPLMDVVYTCSRILFRLKRKEVLIHATTWMNLENTMFIERSQTGKDKYSMIPLT